MLSLPLVAYLTSVPAVTDAPQQTLALSLFCIEITLLVPGSPVLPGRSPDWAANVPGGGGGAWGLPSVPPQRVRARAEALSASGSV